MEKERVLGSFVVEIDDEKEEEFVDKLEELLNKYSEDDGYYLRFNVE